MIHFIKKITFVLVSWFGVLLLITFIPLRYDFFIHELADTQYEKIVWIIENINNNNFDKHYKVVFLGSSQCLYGVNDSILGDSFLNLAVNTPSRDLDLYISQALLSHNVKFDSVCQIVSVGSNISYGTHKVMPFLVTPYWYFKNGQSMISIHFWRFIFARAAKVIASWLSYSITKTKYDCDYTKYGVRFLKKSINNNFIPDTISSFSYCTDKIDPWEEFRYNYMSQTNFFYKLRDEFNVSYLIMPSFGKPKEYFQATQSFRSCFPEAHIICLNEKQKDLIIDTKLWADGGHMNVYGSEKFSQDLTKLMNPSK